MSDLLHSAVRYLSDRCDGALAEDGMGFNKIDSMFGKSLGRKDPEQWTPRMARAAWKMVRKYKGQLESGGIEFSEIPEPPLPTTLKPRNSVYVADGQFVIGFDYDPVIVAAVKEIQGRKFNPATKAWTVPMAGHVVEQLLNFMIKYEFDYNGDVVEACDQLTRDTREMIDTSRAMDTKNNSSINSTLTMPDLGGVLMPFQEVAVLYAHKAKRLLIGDQMGLGKTIECLASLEAEGAYPALIVVPAVVKLNWERESRKWLPDRDVYLMKNRRDNTWAQGTVEKIIPDIVITTYELMSSLVMKHQETGKYYPIVEGWKAIVFDEHHYLKSFKAKRTQIAKVLAKGVKFRQGLSGTPALNRPNELLSPLAIIGQLDALGGFWYFAKRYCKAWRSPWGWDMTGAANLDELNEKMRSLCYIRRLKEDVLTELPAKRRAILTVQLTNRKEYDYAKANLLEWIYTKELEDEDFTKELDAMFELTDEQKKEMKRERADTAEQRAAQAKALVEIEKLKQLAVQGKMESIEEWVKDFLETGEKLVIFGWHVDVVSKLGATFAAPVISGGTPLARRQGIVDDFQNSDECQLIVCNMKAGGVGINLFAAQNVLFVEQGWTPADHDQAEDRIHRIGQKGSAMCWYMLAENTIDTDIYDLIEAKRKVVDAVTEGGEVKKVSILTELVNRLKGDK